MSASTVRRDLMRTLDVRLTRLLNDSMALYEAADIEPGEAVFDHLSLLLTKLAAAATALQLPPEALLDALDRRLLLLRKKLGPL